jgi:hypothetical protein
MYRRPSLFVFFLSMVSLILGTIFGFSQNVFTNLNLLLESLIAVSLFVDLHRENIDLRSKIFLSTMDDKCNAKVVAIVLSIIVVTFKGNDYLGVLGRF